MSNQLLLRLVAVAALVVVNGAVLRAQSNYATPYAFTTLAGKVTGSPGSTDGTGSAARFYSPAGVAVDGAGSLYVADLGNHTIRKITAGGVVTTLAGTAGSPGAAVVTTLAGTAGSPGAADGTGSAARFNSPFGVAVDGAGNVYVADTFNHTIRKITAGGVVTTLAGTAGSAGWADGTGNAARFYRPYGVAVDSTGNVFVADTYSCTIRKITAGGVVTTLAGTAGSVGWADGTGGAAQFNYPSGVAADSAGTVYVADYFNHTIRQIAGGGAVTTLAGTAGSTGFADGLGSAARFYYPSGVAVDGSGNLYVADNNNSTIRKVTSSGVVTTLAGTAGSTGSADGFGSAARFYSPRNVAVDGAGNVYVADNGSHTIRQITSGGAVTTLAGAAFSSGSTDGTGSAARFYAPFGLAADSAGNIYVADTGNSTIRKITSGGVVTTLAGMAGSSGATDGLGSAARFASPTGVAV
ncbi:MAG: NHL repeat-containing protein, partial [Opitutales bacterium]|nr:NHL repeat-containing protein [Opitutales bacterium]